MVMKNRMVNMKKIFGILAFAGLFASCTTDGVVAEPENEISLETEKPLKLTVVGESQKGPFLVGSSVTVQEIDSVSFVQTGKSFKGKVVNEKGGFSVENVNVSSPYALLEVEGYFRNEVTGEKSQNTINMVAICNMTDRSQVNINLLTHLEFERVQTLLAQGMTIAEAKHKAHEEIFSVFFGSSNYEMPEDLDIFGGSDSDGALLAISVLMLGNASEAEFMERLLKLGLDLADDGIWNDSLLKAELADWACITDLTDGFPFIRHNMESWKLSDSVARFEPKIRAFWEDLYGLGECGTNEVGTVKKNKLSTSSFYGMEFKCSETGRWEKDYLGRFLGCDSCGLLNDGRNGKIYKTIKMNGLNWMAQNLDYDIDVSLSTVDSVCPAGWRLPTRTELKQLLEYASKDGYESWLSENGWHATSGNYWSSTKELYSRDRVDRNVNLVGSELWRLDVSSMFWGQLDGSETGVRCVEGEPPVPDILPVSEAVPGTFTDERDGKIYKTVTIKNQVWMAEKMNSAIGDTVMISYVTGFPYNPRCLTATPYSQPDKQTECAEGRKYTWADAQTICPEGWKLPSKEDVEQLLDLVGGSIGSSPLLTTGYYNSENIYGFSAWSPGDYLYVESKNPFDGSIRGGVQDVRIAFWLSDSEDAANAYLWIMDRYDSSFDTYEKKENISVRCMKNL